MVQSKGVHIGSLSNLDYVGVELETPSLCLILIFINTSKIMYHWIEVSPESSFQANDEIL